MSLVLLDFYTVSVHFSDLSYVGPTLIIGMCSVAVIEHSLQKYLDHRGFNLVYDSRGIESVVVKKVTKQQKLEAGCQEFHAILEAESRTV